MTLREMADKAARIKRDMDLVTIIRAGEPVVGKEI